MRMMMWLLAVALLLTALPGLAKEPTPKDVIKKGDYAAMVTECNLTEDQQVKLGEKVIEYNKAVADWTALNKAKVDQLNADIKAAREAGDKAKVKELSEQSKVLTAERAAISTRYRKEMLDGFTPEQQTLWAAYLVRVDVVKFFRKIKFAPEQIDKLKPLCATAQQEIAKLADGDKKSRAKIMTDLYATVKKDVLTDEQRAVMDAPPAPKPAANPQ